MHFKVLLIGDIVGIQAFFGHHFLRFAAERAEGPASLLGYFLRWLPLGLDALLIFNLTVHLLNVEFIWPDIQIHSNGKLAEFGEVDRFALLLGPANSLLILRMLDLLPVVLFNFLHEIDLFDLYCFSLQILNANGLIV